MSSAEFVIDCFVMVGRQLGLATTKHSMRHRERAPLDEIEMMALEMVQGVDEAEQGPRFAKIVHTAFRRYAKQHREDPDRLPWKSSFIASRWAQLAGAA